MRRRHGGRSGAAVGSETGAAGVTQAGSVLVARVLAAPWLDAQAGVEAEAAVASGLQLEPQSVGGVDLGGDGLGRKRRRGH